jgi:hypothetical protein
VNTRRSYNEINSYFDEDAGKACARVFENSPYDTDEYFSSMEC